MMKLTSEYFRARVYYDVPGFYKRYFEGKDWANYARNIYKG
jgi:hypothetical protein